MSFPLAVVFSMDPGEKGFHTRTEGANPRASSAGRSDAYFPTPTLFSLSAFPFGGSALSFFFGPVMSPGMFRTS